MRVAIAGGGIIGLSIGFELASRGVEVELFERDRVGEGASSVAAGMLAPELEAHADDPTYRLGALSLAMYPDWIGRIEGACLASIGMMRSGALDLVGEVPEWLEGRVERLSGVQLVKLFPGLEAQAALHFPQVAQVEPRRVLYGLREGLRRLGATIHEGAEVSRVEARGLETSIGSFAADRVVLATGAHAPGARPIKGQIFELSLPASLRAPIVRAEGVYIVPRGDHRVVVGATVEDVGFDGRRTAGATELLARAIRVMPALANATLERHDVGFRPFVRDRGPGIGENDGVIVAGGHFRNGVLWAPATAAAVAAIVLGERTPFDLAPFSPS